MPPDEYRQAREQAALFDISNNGKIDVTGPEAARFLHNLSTNDIVGLPIGAGREAFFTTVKAKVIGSAVIYRVGAEEFWLDLPAESAARVFTHLDRHLISERLALTDRTAEYAQLHVTGPGARAVVEAALAAPLEDLAEPGVQNVASIQTRRHDPLGIPGYDLLVPVGQKAEWQGRLANSGATPASEATFEILRVEAGTPRDGVDFDEERFVVEVGRTARAICYTKGCYLGQEPIVMARDRGHVNRTLLGLKIEGGAIVAAKARVLREGVEMGAVTSAVLSPRLGSIALAYLRRGNWEPGTGVSVETTDGLRAAAVSSLPFAGSF